MFKIIRETLQVNKIDFNNSNRGNISLGCFLPLSSLEGKMCSLTLSVLPAGGQ